MFKPRLFSPGPVEVPPVVLEAMARPMIHHRTPAFQELFLGVRTRLAELACVPTDDLIILAGSGTSALEAGLLAVAPQGSKVLGLQAGKFGARWLDIARTFGYQVVEVAAPFGKAIDPDAVRQALRHDPDVSTVIATHSETSTGVLHDVAAIAEAVRSEAPDALFMVDAVTSLGAAELRPRAWGLDGVFAGSQKGLMVPPGLAFAWLSERAWARHEASGAGVGVPVPPSYYLDLSRERLPQRKGQTAFTPAVSLLAGLSSALDLLLAEGIESVWHRRRQLNDALIKAGAAAGFTPFAERPSPATAALLTPEGVAAPDVVRFLASRGMTVGGGQDALKPRLVRPSVIGYADRYDVLTLAAALEEAARAFGHMAPIGSATSAAMAALEA